MDIYMPIAEMSVNVPLIFAVGAGVGLLSGLFGVGGGFLMTPLLFFIGIPSAVAVATG
ncbi:MAG: sulfite exporter TauE/SafE family protein, partial [Rhodospirillales bacterium]